MSAPNDMTDEEAEQFLIAGIAKSLSEFVGKSPKATSGAMIRKIRGYLAEHTQTYIVLECDIGPAKDAPA